MEKYHGFSAPFGPLSGQIMSAVKEGCRKAFQAQPQRLVAAMYSCSVQVNAEVLGELCYVFLLHFDTVVLFCKNVSSNKYINCKL